MKPKLKGFVGGVPVYGAAKANGPTHHKLIYVVLIGVTLITIWASWVAIKTIINNFK
jgi:hypothetical protein